MFAHQAVEAAAKVGERAGFALVDYGVVGVILLISLGSNFWFASRMMKVQDKRVEDKEEDNKRLERMVVTTTEAISKVSAAVTSLERSDRDSALALQGMKNTLDTVVMQAMFRGRGSPHSGMPRVREDEGGR